MNENEMTAGEMMTHFLETGELSEMPIIKIPKEKAILLKNGNFKIHFRKLLDEVSKVKNNPWEKFSAEHIETIALTKEGLNERIIYVMILYIIYYPQEQITFLKSESFHNAVFKDNRPDDIDYARWLVSVCLFTISHADYFYNPKSEMEKTLITFLRAKEGFLKDYLQGINDISQQPNSIKKDNIDASETTKELSMREKVENAFSFMQRTDPRKHKLILNENDFNNLVGWVTYYFENEFKLPEIKQPIQKVNTNKGNVIYTFMNFFKQEHPAKTRPESLFILMRTCFYEYRDDEITNLKKQKEPQYYNDLIRNNR